jgi:outer membrane immunogenic protein
MVEEICMMRVLTSVAALALMSGAAAAADLPLPVEPAPVAAPVVYDWTGVYIGLQTGWKWADSDFGFDDDDGFLDDFDDDTIDFDGWFAGGHVGYRFQWNWLVAGLEGDLEWVDVDGETSFDTDDDGDDELRISGEIDWEGSIRGTLGVGFDRVHVYGTGGFAFAGVEHSLSFEDVTIRHDDNDDTRVGWTLGAGVDVAVTDRITVGALYKYVDLGDDDSDVFDDDSDGRFDTDLTYHSIQARVAFTW